MDRINSWKLADELNVYQIVLLIAGYDPAEFEADGYDRWPDEVSRDVSPYVNAIKNAVRSEKIGFNPVRYDGSRNSEIDWDASTIVISSLCDWLRARNFADGFFIASQDEVDSLANPAGEFYAPKLAAAVRAWHEVTADPEALNGKTPKKALEIWLRKHANEYGLTAKDGNPNELGIEEVSKVANWKLAETIARRASRGNLALFRTLGNHANSRGLPGGAKGIQTVMLLEIRS
jgi:hypothetical protein